MHLLSESATWETESEFVDGNGNISRATGESKIEVFDNYIINKSWIDLGGNKISNDYRIEKSSENRYLYRSNNPSLGVQIGTFGIDRNVVFSKFQIENTHLNGYEIIIRKDCVCDAYGALYDNNELKNTWNAKMTIAI